MCLFGLRVGMGDCLSVCCLWSLRELPFLAVGSCAALVHLWLSPNALGGKRSVIDPLMTASGGKFLVDQIGPYLPEPLHFVACAG